MSVNATTFPGEAASVPSARRFVQTTLEDMGLHAAWDAAQLPLSELVSNCVIHTRSTLTVTVVHTGDVVRISVDDQSPALPRQRNYGTDSTTGRGLRLVDTLATSWGVEQHAHGKTVWFEVPAAGSGSRVPEAWDDEVDVDALLAAFEDPGDGVDAVTVLTRHVPTSPSAAA